MKLLLSEYWEKIRFRNYDDFSKKMGAVLETLTVIQTVKDAVEKKAITEEEGKLLKARVFTEVDRLIGLGATLPFDHDIEEISQRALLIEKREVKLLGAGDSQDRNRSV
jgi:hypothetical protein